MSKRNHRQIAIVALRDQLLARRRLLTQVLRDDLHGIADYHAANGSDLLDAAADAVSDAVNTGLIRSEGEELAAINDAIGRIDRGDYGQCGSCDRDIPLGRLRTVPFAVHCIECQRRNEATATTSIASLWQRAEGWSTPTESV